jgi:hypothetical protein
MKASRFSDAQKAFILHYESRRAAGQVGLEQRIKEICRPKTDHNPAPRWNIAVSS